MYEYKKEIPTIIPFNKIRVGYKVIECKKKTFFGKEKLIREIIEISISEQEWLNSLGQEGWELVNVKYNSFDSDIREYFFKRKIN